MDKEKKDKPVESEVPVLGDGGTSLIVPRGLPGLPAFIFDMTEIYRIEDRLPEVRTVTVHTYRELTSEFNVAYNKLSKYISAIRYEIMNLKKHIDMIQSELMIDKYPEFYASMKKQGMSDSSQLRQSFLMKDNRYTMALDKLNALEALDGWLQAKSKAFVHAYQASKKIVDVKNGSPGGYHGY